jgi:hypothetical protein
MDRRASAFHEVVMSRLVLLIALLPSIPLTLAHGRCATPYARPGRRAWVVCVGCQPARTTTNPQEAVVVVVVLRAEPNTVKSL